MKLTSSFIVYLNESNKVHCAKCRITGRFVKRSIAQNEYEVEYAYTASFKAFMAMLITFLYIVATFKTKAVMTLEQLESDLFKAYQEQDYVKFNTLNAKRFELEYGA